MSLDHVNVSCCYEGCFAVITLHPNERDRLKRTHEWFYCPAGHQQHFSGKTEEEKRIAELERVIRNNNSRASTDHEIRERLVDALKVCPLACGYRSRRHTQDHTPWGYSQMVERIRSDLVEHLCREHGVEIPASAEVDIA